MRVLSNEFVNDLKTGVLSELKDMVINRDDLVICFRENYINVYYKCHSMFKITELMRYKKYKVEFDIMYLRYMDGKAKKDILDKLKNKYDIRSNNNYLLFYINKSGEKYTKFGEISKYYRVFMDDWFKRNGKMHLEKEIQQQVFVNQLKNSEKTDGYLYYDLEFALPKHRREFGRADLLGVEIKGGKTEDIVFAELKSNEAACAGGTSDIQSHLGNYAKMMSENYDYYSDMCFAIDTYKKLGIIKQSVNVGGKKTKKILLLFSHDAQKWLDANKNNLPNKVGEFLVNWVRV